MQKKRLTDRSLKLISLLISAALLVAVVPQSYAVGGKLGSLSDALSSSAVSATAVHDFRFGIGVGSSTIGSISFEFCSNTAIIGDACSVPAGFSASGASLSAQSGETGFSISGASTANKLILTRSAALPSVGMVGYTFSNVVNPSAAGSYYVRIQTFSSTNATGSNIEQGGIAFAVASMITITGSFGPFLTFCAATTISAYDCGTATGSDINFGDFSDSATRYATSQIVASSNASGGYSIVVSGSTLTSLGNTIPAMGLSAASTVGTSQFGINLRGNSAPAVGADKIGPGPASVSSDYDVADNFKYASGDTIVSSGGASDSNKFTVSYIVNIEPHQMPGVYASNFTFLCLANF